jgi:hypothetical protein
MLVKVVSISLETLPDIPLSPVPKAVAKSVNLSESAANVYAILSIPSLILQVQYK